MTSSLVGSEMCIRDRVTEVARPLTPGPAGQGSLQWHPCTEGGRISIKPVSYTHLTLPTICSV
eukprot:410879-Prorocentrum_lima.AAC.1